MIGLADRPLRTVLYMPGSNARAIEKARTLDCDGVILDLEDAVAPESKTEAREHVADALKKGGFGHRFMMLRINAADTPWHEEDIALANAVSADAVLIPKINTPQDVFDAGARLKTAPLWAMMETPLAMLNAAAIAAQVKNESKGLPGFVMGTNDLAKDTGARLVPGRGPMLAWLSTCVAAARAYGLSVLDGVFNSIDNDDGFIAECKQGRDLGMDGKTVIHPKQLAACNAIFSPDPEEVAFAHTVIEAFDRQENADKGALRIDGRMVERLHADMARKTVALAATIAARAE